MTKRTTYQHEPQLRCPLCEGPLVLDTAREVLFCLRCEDAAPPFRRWDRDDEADDRFERDRDRDYEVL